MPFLTDRRLVIVEDALQPYTGRGKENVRKAFLDLLETLPQTTALVLITPDSRKYRRGSFQWEKLSEKNWLIAWTIEQPDKAVILDCALPTDAEMAQWVRAKASRTRREPDTRGCKHAG